MLLKSCTYGLQSSLFMKVGYNQAASPKLAESTLIENNSTDMQVPNHTEHSRLKSALLIEKPGWLVLECEKLG